MAIFSVQFTTDSFDAPDLTKPTAREQCTELLKFIEGSMGQIYKTTTLEAFATGVVAQAEVVFSGASGTVGATIGGTAVTFAHGASDVADATSLIAAVNANTTVNKWVVASQGSSTSKVYITSLVAGHVANNITIAASGTGVSITGALTRLAGGSNTAKTSLSF